MYALNLEYRMNCEYAYFTKRWPRTDETFVELRTIAAMGLRVWEVNQGLNPRLVSCLLLPACTSEG